MKAWMELAGLAQGRGAGMSRRERLDRAQDVAARRGICSLQDDFSVANAAGATVRADINAQLQSLATLSSGTAAPGTTYANQLWVDTTNALAKKRNNANSVWQTFASRDFDVWLLGDGAVGAPAYSFSGDTDCGMYRIGANNVGWAVGGVKVFEISGTTLTAHTLTVSTGTLGAQAGTFATTLVVTGLISTAADVQLTGTGQGIKSDTGYRAISFNNQAVTIPGTLALTATASPTGTGTGAVGQIAWDTSYLYICTATNDWRRVALTDF